MDWLNGYSSSWKAVRVNPDTWDDEAEVEHVRSVRIERDCTDATPLLETGTLLVDSNDTFDAGWVRIYMDATDGATERVAIATMLFERSSVRYEKGVAEVSANGFSVLKPASDRKLARGTYAPHGCNGANFVRDLLKECIPAPIVVEGSFTLADNVVFEMGSSYLQAAWLVLNAGNWCLQIEGDGTVYMRPMPDQPALVLDKAHASLLIPGIDEDFDLSEVPNRYYAIDGEQVAIVTNEDERSVASFQSRGRWIDIVDTSPVLVNSESLYNYAKRRLCEESTVLKICTYTREYWPGVYPNSIVLGSVPTIGLEGNLRVRTQSLECGKGIKVVETAGQEVPLW